MGESRNNDLIAEKALAIRQKVILNLDHYLVEFETAYLKGKGKLHWAYNSDDAFQIVLKIINSTSVTDYFIENDPAITELTLGDRLKNKADYKHLTQPLDTMVYITGCAFVCAEPPTAYFNKKGVSRYIGNDEIVPVLIVTIDQLLPSILDLKAIAPLACKTSNDSFELVSLLNKRPLNVIVIDNGRSKLLAKDQQRKLLELGHPKYVTRSKHYLKELEKLYYGHLDKNDPIEIINDYLLDGYLDKDLMLNLSIEDVVIAGREERAIKNKTENDIIWRTWKSAMLNRKVLNRSSFGPLSLMKSFMKRGFGSLRTFPKVEKGSFSEQWVKQRPNVVESRKLTDIPKGQLLVRRPATDGLNDKNENQ